MAEFNPLTFTIENDVVFPHHVTAAHDSKPDPAIITGTGDTMTGMIRYLRQVDPAAPCCRLTQGEGSTGWRIDFMAMMGFNNFDIPAVTKGAANLFHQIGQHGDPDRGIGAPDNRCFLRGLAQPADLIIIMPGCTDHHGQASGGGKVGMDNTGTGGGEIDDDIRLCRYQRIRIIGDHNPAFTQPVEDTSVTPKMGRAGVITGGHQLKPLGFSDSAGDHSAHAAGGPGQGDADSLSHGKLLSPRSIINCGDGASFLPLVFTEHLAHAIHEAGGFRVLLIGTGGEISENFLLLGGQVDGCFDMNINVEITLGPALETRHALAL